MSLLRLVRELLLLAVVRALLLQLGLRRMMLAAGRGRWRMLEHRLLSGDLAGLTSSGRCLLSVVGLPLGRHVLLLDRSWLVRCLFLACPRWMLFGRSLGRTTRVRRLLLGRECRRLLVVLLGLLLRLLGVLVRVGVHYPGRKSDSGEKAGNAKSVSNVRRNEQYLNTHSAAGVEPRADSSSPDN